MHHDKSYSNGPDKPPYLISLWRNSRGYLWRRSDMVLSKNLGLVLQQSLSDPQLIKDGWSNRWMLIDLLCHTNSDMHAWYLSEPSCLSRRSDMNLLCPWGIRLSCDQLWPQESEANQHLEFHWSYCNIEILVPNNLFFTECSRQLWVQNDSMKERCWMIRYNRIHQSMMPGE